MTITAFLILLLIAGICGAIGQAITGFDLGGFLVTIASVLSVHYWVDGWPLH